MSSPLLEVKDLQVTVGEEQKVLLDGLNLTIYPGETHVLMGHNGAGKSTLMSALMGDSRSRPPKRSPASRWRISCARPRTPLPASPSKCLRSVRSWPSRWKRWAWMKAMPTAI